MNTKFSRSLAELTEETNVNPSHEGRATAVLHRIATLYREALSAGDLAAVKEITDELGRREVELGAAIAGKGKSGSAGSAA